MVDVLIEQVILRNSTDIEKLLYIWENSVKATHLFLTQDDIKMLIPHVELGIEGIDKLIVAKDKLGEPLGFIGVENKKIEMLFISSEHFGKGIGKLLINYVINTLEANLVDVNEQNPQALEFYKHLGFEVYDRSETDEQGNPFPILHMKFIKDKSVE
ncbi:acetyltransferase, GNAT family [Gottschalkia acidurici 9a]|uniref:Acetyltransferase, GNAT family n=1 Tax=Gottschalkia acidurici (strain ATCC 7906 / DSM 604 / BCRC 14475 / CIP 104303 / KCTC 5404 / NCIMB 10678 / 9a) TaxID=1128398 RepID=K0AYL2_GOTA9|nr:GNAT family N-acetyltransferase [Gottschalkia acidurici]AFS77825.1 acetyltransferase, GNAT family [Gottschalkia acidurici 9a]